MVDVKAHAANCRVPELTITDFIRKPTVANETDWNCHSGGGTFHSQGTRIATSVCAVLFFHSIM